MKPMTKEELARRKAEEDKKAQNIPSMFDDKEGVWKDKFGNVVSNQNAGNGVPSIVNTFTGSKLFHMIYPQGSNKFFDDPQNNTLPEGTKFNIKYLFSNKETRRQMADAMYANKIAKNTSEKYFNPDHKIDESRQILNEAQHKIDDRVELVGKVSDNLLGINPTTQQQVEQKNETARTIERIKAMPAINTALEATGRSISQTGSIAKQNVGLNNLEGSEEDAKERRAVAYKQGQDKNFEDLEANRFSTIGDLINVPGQAMDKFRKGWIAGKYNRNRNKNE